MRLTVTDLLPNTRYGIQVRANDSEAVSHWSRVFYVTTIQDDAVPNTPTGVTWVVSGNTFHGEWSSITTNTNGDPAAVTHYEVELVAGGITKVVSVPQKTDGTKVTYDLSYETNRALFGSPKGSVQFRVRAVDNVNLPSAWSVAINTQNALPAPVMNLVANGVTDGISLTWNPPADTDVVGYNVYVGSTSGFVTSSANRVNAGPLASPVFFYSTSTYTLLYVKVTSVDAFGQESTAVQASATPKSPFNPDTTAPGVPANLAATISRDSNNNASATLTWTKPSDSDLAGYVIRYKKTTDTNWTTQTIDKSLTTAVVPILAFYDYNFSIAAFDQLANYSAFSATVTATGSIAGAPPQVNGVTVLVGSESVTTSWNASTAADVIKYEVQVATDSAFTQNLLDYTTGNTSITVAGLDAGATYWIRVRAIDTSGTSGTWSAAVSVTLNTTGGGAITIDDVLAGTWAGKEMLIGAGGEIVVDQTGVIKSNNYSPGVTGYQLSSSGLEINDGSVKANAIVSGTIGAQTITLATGGVLKSADYNATNKTGWQIGGATNSLAIYNGTISGGAVKTGQIVSNTNVTRNGVSVPSWSINLDGNAQFNDALVHGHLVVGDAGGSETDSYLQSGNYVPGTTGWTIRGDGYAEFRNIQANSMLSNSLTVEARNSESVLVNSTFEDPAVVNGAWNYNSFSGWGLQSTVGAVTTSQNTTNPISGSRSVTISFPDSASSTNFVHLGAYPVIPGQTWAFSCKFRSNLAIDKSAITDSSVVTLWMRTSTSSHDPGTEPDDGVNVIWTNITNLETVSPGFVNQMFDLGVIPTNHTRMTVMLEIESSGIGAWSVDIDDFRASLNMDEFDIYGLDPSGSGDIVAVASIDSLGNMQLGGDMGVAGSLSIDGDSLLVDGSPISEGIHVGDLESDNEPVFAGEDLTQWIRDNYRMRVAVAQSSTVDSSIGGGGMGGIITVGNMKADHNYRIYYAFSFSTSGTVQDWEAGIYTEASPTTPTINSNRLPASVCKWVSPSSADKVETIQKMCQYSPSVDGDYKLGFGIIRIVGAGTGTIHWSNQMRPIIFVEDLGPIAGTGASIAQKNKSSGTDDSDPTPVNDTYTPTKYTRTWTATWSRTYQGNGNQINLVANNKDMHQGYYSGTNGNTKSAMGFDYVDIQNHLADPGGGKPATSIVKVEVYLYFNHWYYNSGGTAVIGRHSQTVTNAGTWSSVISGPSYIGADHFANWPKPGGKWVDITDLNAIGWKNGDNKGILLGPGDTTSLKYYGIANGPDQANKPKLRITYKK